MAEPRTMDGPAGDMPSAQGTPPKRRARRRASEGPAIDRDRLIAALCQLAKSEGVGSLNMRRVAEELDVSPRLLYRHVRDKHDMIGLLTNEIIGLVEIDLTGGIWSDRLRRLHAGMRQAYLSFPGAAAEIMPRMLHAATLPKAGAVRNGLFAIFRDAGLDHAESARALVQFSILTLGGLIAEENTAADAPLVLPADQIGHAVEDGIEILIAAIAQRTNQ